MTTRRQHIEVGGISVQIIRKDIKNLHLGVYPPNGRVRVAAPLRLDDDAVRLAVVSRMGWIRRQQAGFRSQDRQSAREMVTGESHYYLGRRYRLKVITEEGLPQLRLRNNSILELKVSPGTSPAAREGILAQWYRQQLYGLLPPLIDKWQLKAGLEIREVRVKRMKTLWGSCSTAARRIWLNLELAKKPAVCVEYILVHEMAHFLVRHHDEQFRELMDKLMPSWRTARDQLNRAPLAHEEWEY